MAAYLRKRGRSEPDSVSEECTVSSSGRGDDGHGGETAESPRCACSGFRYLFPIDSGLIWLPSNIICILKIVDICRKQWGSCSTAERSAMAMRARIAGGAAQRCTASRSAAEPTPDGPHPSPSPPCCHPRPLRQRQLKHLREEHAAARVRLEEEARGARERRAHLEAQAAELEGFDGGGGGVGSGGGGGLGGDGALTADLRRQLQVRWRYELCLGGCRHVEARAEQGA